MATVEKSIKALYDEAILEAQRVMGSDKSSSSQRNAAVDTVSDLTTLLLGHTIQTIQGRTALLAGLIVELNEITAHIQVAPPYLDAIKSFTDLTKKAADLLNEEKKNLV